MKQLNIQLLLTGDELMRGDVIDSNSCMMADILQTKGLSLSRKVTVGDDLSHLIREIENMTHSADVLIVNGGLGPTVDDKTAEALSVVVKQPLIEHADAIDDLSQWCIQRGFELNGPNRKQAFLPEGITLVNNPIGSAPGFSITHNNCLILCTPGVPIEAKAMLKQSILPVLESMAPSSFTKVTRWQIFGVGESSAQLMLQNNITDWPPEVLLGFRASFPQLELKLTIQRPQDQAILTALEQKIERVLGAHIIGENSVKLPNLVVELLSKKQQKIALAESCTGGLIASKLTAVSGASAIFEMGIVCYSNSIKNKVLGVSKEGLERFGAVSEQVVDQMAKGALMLSGAHWSIAVSGIAGPDGGSEEKPVGTVWIAWGNNNKIKTQKLHYPGGRKYFQQYVAYAGLDLIRRELLNIQDEPLYFKSKKP
jgi:nicotinamide-nucleotide amidase